MSRHGSSSGRSLGVPGKRTLTQGLPPRPWAPVQRQAEPSQRARLDLDVDGDLGDGAEAEAALAAAGLERGSPLPDGVRAKMERSLGADFSDVRVHEGATAAALGALAFAQGSTLYFAPGQYAPDTARGQALLGHELAHVVQQRANRVPTPSGTGAPINADPALEAEAERAGELAARGECAYLAGSAARSAGAATPLAGPIQRAVGFELEINSIRTYAKEDAEEAEDEPADAPKDDSKTPSTSTSTPADDSKARPTGVAARFRTLVSNKLKRKKGKGKERDKGKEREKDEPVGAPKEARKAPATWLKKKDELLTAPGFKVEADEMSDHSNLEIVTDAFPETVEGGVRLLRALTEITKLLHALAEKDGQELAASELARAVDGGVAVAHRFLRPTEPVLIGKPQATVGIKLARMERLLADMASGEGRNGGNAKALFGGGLQGADYARNQVPAERLGLVEVERALVAARQALAPVQPSSSGEASSSQAPPAASRSELIALVAQLVMYLMRGAKGVPGYGKTIALVMSRTDFATIFKLVPDEQKPSPEELVTIVMDAARHAAGDNGLSDDSPVFSGGLYQDKTMYPNREELPGPKALPQLTRAAWLRGIAEGTDLLTKEHFPGDDAAKNEMESLGGYGELVDTELDAAAPIFELRGLDSIYANLFPLLALDLFRYVHTINTGGSEDLPGHLLNLAGKDRSALLFNDDQDSDPTEVRKRALEEAGAEIRKWQ